MDKGKWRSFSIRDVYRIIMRWLKYLGITLLGISFAALYCLVALYLAKSGSPIFYYAMALSSPASVLGIFEEANEPVPVLKSEVPAKIGAQNEENEPPSEGTPEEITADEVPESRQGKITEKFYSPNEGGIYIKYNNTIIKNCTQKSREKILSMLETESEITTDKVGTEPEVFIYHTHATEAFEKYDRGYFDLDEDWRSTDTTETVVALGDEICSVLGEHGIATLHDKTLHDDPGYKGSYQRSAITIKNALEENPNIKIALDIHRDAIEPSEKEIIKPTCEINGKKAAQIMIIAGCDDGTMNMPNYWENLRFAVKIADKMGEMYPGLCRFILFDYRKYNMDLSAGLLLIEIGSTGNTLDEALYSAGLLAEVLANI